MRRKMWRIIKADKETVFAFAEDPSLALEVAGIKGSCCDIQEVTDKMLDEMELDELEKMDAAYPPELSAKVEEVLQAFGQALGEARVEWADRIMNGEDVPMFIQEEKPIHKRK